MVAKMPGGYLKEKLVEGFLLLGASMLEPLLEAKVGSRAKAAWKGPR